MLRANGGGRERTRGSSAGSGPLENRRGRSRLGYYGGIGVAGWAPCRQRQRTPSAADAGPSPTTAPSFRHHAVPGWERTQALVEAMRRNKSL